MFRISLPYITINKEDIKCRSFLLSILVLFVAIYAMGCEGGREDILSLSQYSISLIDDEESKAGGYTKLYISIKDPVFNVEVFPNARAAIDSKGWIQVWIQTVIAEKKPIPQIVGFDSESERDKFINELNMRADEGIQWAFEYYEYESDFLFDNFGTSTVYVIEFKPVLPDYDNLTPTQVKLLDIYPAFITNRDPLEFSSVDIELLIENGIEVTFNEAVTGDLKLIMLDVNVAGAIVELDMGWVSHTQGNVITLTPGDNSKSFINRYAYYVSGSVMDIAGNVTNVDYYFKVYAPDPYIVSSYPQDGAANVDPDQVFKDGITVVFNRPMTGKLSLKQGNKNMEWTSVSEGNTIKLTGVKGQELEREAVYTIEGTVQDEFGGFVFVYIDFVTQALE